jgi:hypothetical protein
MSQLLCYADEGRNMISKTSVLVIIDIVKVNVDTPVLGRCYVIDKMIMSL